MTPPRNLPNLITGTRVVLALVLFALLSLVAAARGAREGWLVGWAGEERLLLNLCGAIFITAAVSDFLDGYIARRWGLVTDFGRIVDPFADKVIVCGTFVQLVPLQGSRVASWMVVLILARELLVDGLRGFAESRGVSFSALKSGKLKMFAQSVGLSYVLLSMANFAPEWGEPSRAAVLWFVVVATLFSGVAYVNHARRVLGADSLAERTGGGAVSP